MRPTGQDPHSQGYFHLDTKSLCCFQLSRRPLQRKSTPKREFVRTYPKRMKVLEASIEDELIGLRIVNQQLLKRLQGQVALEQEVVRFKCLLVDIRGRIKG
ncbi:hypothetical protein MKX03_037563 [Papaver bracteatum]|nr:hypothetical protein MKX03_037563 [Papaver bracteatum]